MNPYLEVLAGCSLLTAALLGQVNESQAVKSGYAPVNGLKMYYEIHSFQGRGSEVPLVLLHGGGTVNRQFQRDDAYVVGESTGHHGRFAGAWADG